MRSNPLANAPLETDIRGTRRSPTLARDLHTSTTAVTGALTAATLTGAAAAIPVGAWLDHHGGRALMSVGSAAGTLLLAVMSTVDSLVGLYALWIGIGLASAMALYEAAFAVVVTWHPTNRGRANALLAVTVVAGFASTIFLPLTGTVVQAYGWRTATLILAAVHGTLTIPLHAVVLRRAPATLRGEPSPDRARNNGGRRTAVRARRTVSRFSIAVGTVPWKTVGGVHYVAVVDSDRGGGREWSLYWTARGQAVPCGLVPVLGD
jgi:MFS family permease